MNERRGFKPRRFNRNFRKPPVEVGQKIELEIIGQGKEGDFVGKYNGFIVFVKGENLEQGKSYEVEIKEVKRNYATASV